MIVFRVYLDRCERMTGPVTLDLESGIVWSRRDGGRDNYMIKLTKKSAIVYDESVTPPLLMLGSIDMIRLHAKHLPAFYQHQGRIVESATGRIVMGEQAGWSLP